MIPHSTDVWNLLMADNQPSEKWNRKGVIKINISGAFMCGLIESKTIYQVICYTYHTTRRCLRYI